jgi:hypothetical protein
LLYQYTAVTILQTSLKTLLVMLKVSFVYIGATYFPLVCQKFCTISGSPDSDHEECRPVGYKPPVRTSQETHYVFATQPSQLMPCKNSGFHGNDCEEIMSSGMLRRVALIRNEVSEERSASIIRVTRIGELATTLTVTSNRCTLLNIPEDVILRVVDEVFINKDISRFCSEQVQCLTMSAKINLVSVLLQSTLIVGFHSWRFPRKLCRGKGGL